MISEEDIERADYLRDEIRDESAIRHLEFLDKEHVGTLQKEDDCLWIVKSEAGVFALHPDDIEIFLDYERRFDNLQSRISFSPIVKFKIIEYQKLSGIVKYAKLKWL